MKAMQNYSEAAEQGILGCLMIDNAVFFDIYGVVEADDFFMPQHRDIFTECNRRIQDGQNASPVTLKGFTKTLPDIDEDYLAGCASTIVSTYNALGYAKHIRDLSERRKLAFAAEQLMTGIDQNREVEDLRNEAFRFLSESLGESVYAKSLRQVSTEAMEEIQNPKARFETGLPSMDRTMAGGLYAGYTYAICGAEKRGKTTFAHTISYNLNENGVKHAYIAMEMGSRQIQKRNLARKIGVNSMEFDQKKPGVLQDASRAIHQTPDNTIYLDMPGCNFDSIRAELNKLALKKQITGFIVDYWQLIGGAERGKSTAEFLFDVAQWFAAFARKHGLWCILLAQVNREGKVFGSAGLEKACDQLYIIDLCEDEKSLWLNLTHSRYTPAAHLGSIISPRFIIDRNAGPHIKDLT